MLTIEAEQELFARVSTGDMAARERIVESNLRHVVGLAIIYARRTRMAADELFASGCLGLLRAIEKYEPERGLRFVTYAAHWIKAFIRDNVQRARSMVPTMWRKRSIDLDVSLDEPVGEDGPTRLEMLEGDAPSQEQEFADDEALSRVRWIAEGVIRREMSPRERIVARSRIMGTDREDCPSLGELSEQIGVCRERVRQIEVGARRKIMHALLKAGVGA